MELRGIRNRSRTRDGVVPLATRRSRGAASAEPGFLRGAPVARRRWRGPLLALGAIVIALLVGTALLGDNGLATHRRLRRERAAAAAEVERLRLRQQELAARIEALRSDPAALERLAREKYSMHHPGEEIIEIIGDERLDGLIRSLPPDAASARTGAATGLVRSRPNLVPAFRPESKGDDSDAQTSSPGAGPRETGRSQAGAPHAAAATRSP